jgi:hypothetical protein
LAGYRELAEHMGATVTTKTAWRPTLDGIELRPQTTKNLRYWPEMARGVTPQAWNYALTNGKAPLSCEIGIDHKSVAA